MNEMIVSERLNRFLKDHHMDYRIVPHRETYTAQETAEAEHVSGKRFIKVVMLKADERNVMVALPADETIDEQRVKQSLEVSDVRLATEHEFQSLFPGCEIGAMPPFGHLYGLPLYMDESLTKRSEIVFNAGTHRTTIEMTFADYQALAKPNVCMLTNESNVENESHQPETKNKKPPEETEEQDSHFQQK